MTGFPYRLAFTAVLGFAAVVYAVEADARPPTVVNSPGYDRALHESRRTYGEATQPVAVSQPLRKKAARRDRQPKRDPS